MMASVILLRFSKTFLLAVLFATPLIPGHDFAQSTAQENLESTVNQLNNHLANGEDDQASRYLDKFLARPDLDPDVLLRVGIAFAHRGLYHEASRVFLRCTRDYPALFEGHYNLALALLAENHPDQALSAIESAPRSPQAQNTAALYLLEKIEASLG